jgi:glycosyltransferase involved in cell wall biosynthesis
MARKLLILNERDLRHPWAGGAEMHIAETGARLARRGYAPTLLCTRFPGAAAEEMQDGVRVRRFGNRLTYYLQLPVVVRRELQTPGTVIIEHLNKVPFCTPLYTRAPLLLVSHHLFGRTAFRQAALPIASVVYAAEKLIPVMYRRHQFVAVSPSTCDDLVSRGVPAAAITVIPNGVDHTRYHDRGAVPDAPPTLLVLGRVEFYKRLDLVLQALQQVRPVLPEIRLFVVGDGAARAQLARQARELGVAEHVTFTGFVSEEEKLTYIRRAHAVVNTSEKEGWGLTVLEANACGVPAIASDVPGLRDAVRDGETGVLVPYGNVAELSTAIVRVLQDDTYRRRLSAGARAWAQRFTWDAVVDDLAAVIESTADGRRISQVAPWFQGRGRTAPARPATGQLGETHPQRGGVA